jgi:hypothetical protein
MCKGPESYREVDTGVIESLADERAACTVDVRVLLSAIVNFEAAHLLAEHERDLALARKVAVADADERVVRLALAESSRVDTGS